MAAPGGMLVSLKMNRQTDSEARTKRIRFNVTVKMITYGVDFAIGLLILPILVNNFNQEIYGAWLIVSSFIVWLRFAAGGVAHGLKNRLAEALALNHVGKAKQLISTAYSFLIIIGIFISLIMLPLMKLNWYSILGVSSEFVSDLKLVVFLTVSVFVMNFSAKLIVSILEGIQKNYIVDIVRILERILVFAGIYCLTSTGHQTLVGLALVYHAIPYVMWIVTTIFIFSFRLKYLKPSFNSISLSVLPNLWNISIYFLIIQISGIVIFSTDRLIISHLFGAADVVPYHIVFRYYSVVLGIASALFYPMWSAHTEANKKQDFEWISAAIRKGRYFSYVLIGIACLMFVLQKPIVHLWVGDKAIVSTRLSAIMLLSVCMQVFGLPYMMYINGVGKIRLQTIFYAIGAIINIPLSIYLAKNIGLGISGIVLSTVMCSLYIPLVAPIHYRKLQSKKANGVWNR